MLPCLFLVALWSPAWKGLTSWLSCLLCFVTFTNVSWPTSELRARLAPYNVFKPSSKIFLLTVPRPYFFCDSFMFFCLVYVMPLCMSVYLYLVVTYWEKASLLALVCGVSL